ncbi:oxidoreductase [Arthrobacter globiformis NBRC 12137]|uniref:Oxidoreductase n=1 Tax=Arthrobacter globiformis (strain ATCC 8010 / DSM 20124 / JCM 1332 / NBRC 12137 / NCIMB 8907 / NRRL B-2979 / 168) TaxID=1077972 RepID=H0QPQ2_ARTG1|nr:SDR family oxidoreductase [Arthrobacter globiformis]GAB14803.1 oxidoreductase [Arthrobacter globiformis NBRC 12137]
MSRFDGAIVVISGAASGIGLALTKGFVAKGAMVAALDVDEKALSRLADEIGPQVFPMQVDVADEQSVEQAIQNIVGRCGGIDVLINNAGIAPTGRLGETTTETWRRIMSIDLDGVFYLTRAALPALMKSGGNIVMTASISGTSADYAYSAYNAAKGALVNLTRSLAIDYAPMGVRCNAVAPGPVRTPLIEANFRSHPGLEEAFIRTVPLGRLAEPEDVVAAFMFLASQEASFINGAILPVDGGVAAWNGQPDANNLPQMQPVASPL